MNPVKAFKVFGEPVDILVNGSMTRGSSAALISITPPGGGPPPHSHSKEDETFIVLEGDFEIFVHGKWHPAPKGEPIFGPRGAIHTYRNSGTTTGKLCVFVSPAGFEDYLEEVGSFSPAADMPKILEISKRFGITFHL